MLKPLRIATLTWPWTSAAAWAGFVIVLALLFNTSDGRISMADVINPLGFGVMTFFGYGGVVTLTDTGEPARNEQLDARRWALDHPLQFALPPAVAVGVILFGLRLVAISSDAEGPWSTIGDSAFDMGFRAVIIYMIIAGSGLVMQRSGLKM